MLRQAECDLVITADTQAEYDELIAQLVANAANYVARVEDAGNLTVTVTIPEYEWTQ